MSASIINAKQHDYIMMISNLNTSDKLIPISSLLRATLSIIEWNMDIVSYNRDLSHNIDNMLVLTLEIERKQLSNDI
jgi:hypothetical protein